MSIPAAFVLLFLGFNSERFFGETWSVPAVVFCNVAAGAVGFLATLPFRPTASPAYREKVDRFFETMHRPVDFAAEVSPGNDLSQLKFIGWFAVVIGGFVCSLVLIPNDVHGRPAILIVGGFVGLTGLLFLWLGGRGAEPEAEAVAGNAPAPPSGKPDPGLGAPGPSNPPAAGTDERG